MVGAVSWGFGTSNRGQDVRQLGFPPPREETPRRVHRRDEACGAAHRDRILFLEGTPEIARYDVIRVGTDVREQIENDLELEMKGVKHYNEAIALCTQLGDNGTREALEPILSESEEHVDWAGSRTRDCLTYPYDFQKVRFFLTMELWQRQEGPGVLLPTGL